MILSSEFISIRTFTQSHRVVRNEGDLYSFTTWKWARVYMSRKSCQAFAGSTRSAAFTSASTSPTLNSLDSLEAPQLDILLRTREIEPSTTTSLPRNKHSSFFPVGFRVFNRSIVYAPDSPCHLGQYLYHWETRVLLRVHSRSLGFTLIAIRTKKETCSEMETWDMPLR